MVQQQVPGIRLSRRGMRPQVEILEDRLAPAAQAIGFTIDQASSSLNLSSSLTSSLGTVTAVEQGAGSLTTSFTGSIKTLVDFAASTLLFSESGTNIDAAVSGNWSPSPGGSAGVASADYGGRFDVGPFGSFGSVFVAIRDLVGTLFTTTPLNLSGSGSTWGFDSDQQLKIASGAADYLANGLIGTALGSGAVGLANLTAANAAGDGTLADLGDGNYRLTLPILVSVTADLVTGVPATLTLQGSIVANASVPVVDLNGPDAGNDFAAAFTEDGGPVAVVAATASIARTPAANLAGATIVLTNRPDGVAEKLTIDVGASGLASSGYNNSTGILTLSGIAPLAVYESVLRTLTYANTSQDPDTAVRLITVAVTDAHNPASESLVRQSTVSVTAVNDAPTRLPSFAKGISYDAQAGVTLKVGAAKGLKRAFRDRDDDPLTIKLLKAPLASLGRVVVRDNGSFAFLAKRAAAGKKVIFRVRAFDGLAFSAALTVTVNVR